MHHVRRSLVAALLALAVTFALTAGIATAGTKKITVHVTAIASGGMVNGPVTGGSFGKGSQTATLNLSTGTTNFVWHVAGGTIKGRLTGSGPKTNHIVGHFVLLGGTGRYAHIKGSGRASITLSSGAATFTGTARV